MEFLDKLFLSIHDRFIKSELKRRNTERETLDFNKVKTIGILFDGSQVENEVIVNDFIAQLNAKGKQVELLGFVPKNNQALNTDYTSFCLHDLDFFKRPNNQKVQEFIQQPFDILINLTPLNHLQLDFIAALSNAKLRVGPYTDRTHCYDLMIDHNEKSNLNSYIKQIDFFLNRLKSSSYESTAI